MTRLKLPRLSPNRDYSAFCVGAPRIAEPRFQYTAILSEGTVFHTQSAWLTLESPRIASNTISFDLRSNLLEIAVCSLFDKECRNVETWKP